MRKRPIDKDVDQPPADSSTADAEEDEDEFEDEYIIQL